VGPDGTNSHPAPRFHAGRNKTHGEDGGQGWCLINDKRVSAKRQERFSRLTATDKRSRYVEAALRFTRFPMPAIATIYEHSNYSGRTLQLQGVGDYDYSTLAFYSFNDLTSSIKLESGYYLQAFADAGFKGASAIFTGSTSYVGNGFNDKISSLRLVRGTPNSSSTIDLSNYGAAYRQPSATTALATLYEHANYGGRPLQLSRVGDYDYATLGSHSFNDLTSSIKIESGYYLQAYTDAGFKGASAIFTGSTSYVGNGFNDRISSLRLVRGTPNVSTVDNSTYGAAYRNKSTPSPAPGPDIITGQPFSTIRKVSDFTQPLSKQPVQGVWNKGGFILGVDWKDPITGATVKSEHLSSGKGSYMLGGPGNRAYDVSLTLPGAEMATWAIKSVIAAGFGLAGGPGFAAAALTALGTFAGEAVPKAKDSPMFVKSPSMDGRHLDVFGTIWNPMMAPGGSLPDSSSFILAGADTRQKFDVLLGAGNHIFL